MMDNPLFALLAPSLLLVPAMGVLSRLGGGSPVRQEIRRKSLHVLGGLVALSFPLFLTSGWMIVLALGLVLLWMLAVRTIPVLKVRFGCVLHDAGRVSRGELYFALAIAGLLLLADTNPVLFVVPVLILSVADAAAAIVGRGWPRGRFRISGADKTVAGSLAFFVAAFAITATALWWSSPLAPLSIYSLSMVVATTCTAAEAVSTAGTDNLTVPGTAWLVLNFAMQGA